MVVDSAGHDQRQAIQRFQPERCVARVADPQAAQQTGEGLIGHRGVLDRQLQPQAAVHLLDAQSPGPDPHALVTVQLPVRQRILEGFEVA